VKQYIYSESGLMQQFLSVEILQLNRHCNLTIQMWMLLILPLFKDYQLFWFSMHQNIISIPRLGHGHFQPVKLNSYTPENKSHMLILQQNNNSTVNNILW